MAYHKTVVTIANTLSYCSLALSHRYAFLHQPTCFGQDGGPVDVHIVKGDRHLVPDLSFEFGQGTPSQHQVSCSRKQHTTIDTMPHKVVVFGIGRDVDLEDTGRCPTRSASTELLQAWDVPWLAVVPLDQGRHHRGASGHGQGHRGMEVQGVQVNARHVASVRTMG